MLVTGKMPVHSKGDAVAFVHRTLVKERPHVQGKCTAAFSRQEGAHAG